MRFRFLSGGVATLMISASSVLGASVPAHVTAAETLVAGMVKQDNADNSYTYTLPPVIKWGPAFANASDCSSFFDLLMEHAYNLSAAAIEALAGTTKGTGTIKAWPQAGTWYNAVSAGTPGTAMTKVTTVSSLMAGDVMFIKYISDGDSTGDTGHVMIGAGVPEKVAATAPLVTGTTQWQWTIIDSTADPHYMSDTRYEATASGTDATGVGEGLIRLYANSNGTLAGYTWSTGTGSAFVPISEHAVVFARPNPAALSSLAAKN